MKLVKTLRVQVEAGDSVGANEKPGWNSRGSGKPIRVKEGNNEVLQRFSGFGSDPVKWKSLRKYRE